MCLKKVVSLRNYFFFLAEMRDERHSLHEKIGVFSFVSCEKQTKGGENPLF